jgi:hypothetical protein
VQAALLEGLQLIFDLRDGKILDPFPNRVCQVITPLLPDLLLFVGMRTRNIREVKTSGSRKSLGSLGGIGHQFTVGVAKAVGQAVLNRVADSDLAFEVIQARSTLT